MAWDGEHQTPDFEWWILNEDSGSGHREDAVAPLLG